MRDFQDQEPDGFREGESSADRELRASSARFLLPSLSYSLTAAWNACTASSRRP
ncbi:hypothetical protein O7631_18410 [Micromonospora sp. WMMD967]|uniref:hypothetical protein n=1 Tax=Micromonospora sp. WMMD967 TaxID=3016101 RepID=UPI0024172901|nr:hypothetical protein [Micromonospora sp. WMMD967]MDG4838490.1 hypothetical protein [Micromonospora sp. WMMD967]